MRKMLRVVAILAAFGLTAWIGVVALAQGSSAPSTPTSIATPAPSTGGEDVKGNCDEAEHANDLECVGVNPVAEDDPANDDQGENEGNDEQGDVEGDDQGENVDNDDQGEDEGNDEQGDVDDDQGENEDNDDQGENDDDQGEDQGNDDEGGDSGPGSASSGPGSSSSGSGS